MVRSGTASHQGRTGPGQRRGAWGWQAVFFCLRSNCRPDKRALSWELRAATQPCYCRKSRSGEKGGPAWRSLAKPPMRNFEKALIPLDLRLAKQALTVFKSARWRHQFDALIACCWRGVSAKHFDGLGGICTRPDDERRNDRIVEDLGGITHVGSNKLVSPSAIRLRFGPFRAQCRRALSLKKGGPGHSTWWQGLTTS